MGEFGVPSREEEAARELTHEQKVKAMMDFWRYSREEAVAMLIDAGEIESGWCEG